MNSNSTTTEHFAVAEKGEYGWQVQERDMTNWWTHQVGFIEDLITTDGERLIVLDPGEVNDGPGPDILNAHIILDDYELFGSVEMHLQSSDWYKHGHNSDPGYEKVILHVVLNTINGPDLPTLRLDRAWLGAITCHANLSLQPIQLKVKAVYRFKQKQSHLKLLAVNKQYFHPLLLGMIEILCSGRNRSQALHEVANYIGLDHWPDTRKWSGSNRSFPKRTSRRDIITEILKQSHLFKPQRYKDPKSSTWQAWSILFEPLIALGLTENQCREWIVNIYAPYCDTQVGFQIWLNLPIFRHYGVEKNLLSKLGLQRICRIFEQQGVLAFEKQYCATGYCARCPLVQSHHTLTQLN